MQNMQNMQNVQNRSKQSTSSFVLCSTLGNAFSMYSLSQEVKKMQSECQCHVSAWCPPIFGLPVTIPGILLHLFERLTTKDRNQKSWRVSWGHGTLCGLRALTLAAVLTNHHQPWPAHNIYAAAAGHWTLFLLQSDCFCALDSLFKAKARYEVCMKYEIILVDLAIKDVGQFLGVVGSVHYRGATDRTASGDQFQNAAK